MTRVDPIPARIPRQAPLRRVALATLLAFGCATVREPVPAPLVGAPPARVRIGEPEIELWVEGTKAITPEEWNEAGAEARAALSGALASRVVGAGAQAVPAPQGAQEGGGSTTSHALAPQGAPDGSELDASHVLVVRERAVVRTEGRKASQVLAVVAIVAVVVIVIVGIIASRGRGGSSATPSKSSGHATGSAPAARPPAPVTSSAGAAPAAGSPRPAPPGAPHPASPAPPPGSAGLPAPPRPVLGTPAPAPAPGVGFEANVGIGLAIPLGEPPPPYPMPPAPPFGPEDRGFFAGDEVVLELELHDARTDQVVWANAVKGDVDPRNREGVGSLLERALAGQAWARGTHQSP